jgi:hypothetical protein
VLKFVGNVASDLVKVDGVGVVQAHKCKLSVFIEAFVDAWIF